MDKTEELAQAQAKLAAETGAAATESTGGPIETLMKALSFLGKSKGTTIIGHEGASAEGVQAPQTPFGANASDESSPNGQAAGATSAAQVEAGSQARIDAALAHGSDAGNRSTSGLQKGGPTAEGLREQLNKSDTGGQFAEAVEASEALERLTDTVLNGIAQLGERLDKAMAAIDVLREDNARGQELTKSLRDAMAAQIEAQVESMQKSLAVSATPAAQIDAVRRPMPGIGLFTGLNAPVARQGQGAGIPQGVTKQSMTEGLMKAVDAGALSQNVYRELAPKIDTRDLADLWDQLPEKVQAIIST